VAKNPRKLSPERRDRIVAAVRRGAHREQAAAAACIAPSTLFQWLSDGEAEHAPPVLRV
jgi:transposase-like protein